MGEHGSLLPQVQQEEGIKDREAGGYEVKV